MSDTTNTLEIVVNLIYLAKQSADDPQKVIEYLSRAENHALQLAQTLQEAPRTSR